MEGFMRVIIGCEFSQVVTKAFRDKGHEAYSCDLLPTEGNPDWHFQEDVLEVIEREKFDLGIFHPPCTYLSYAGTSSWNNEGRVYKRLDGLKFFADLWTAPIEKICIENPAGCASPTIAKFSQIIQPYYWNDPESKKTWLWLKGLPNLKHEKKDSLFGKSTHTKPKIYGTFKNGPKKGQPIYGTQYCKFSEDRGHIRSRFFPGIADAMAEQWG